MNYLNSIFILAVVFVTVFFEAWFDFVRDLLGVQIDLLPALIVYTGLTSGPFTTAFVAVCAGLWFDSLSCNPLGVSILPLFLVGFLVSQNRELLARSSTFAQMMLGFTASAVCPLMTVFLLLNMGSNPILDWKSVWRFLVMTVAGGLFTPLCFRLFEKIGGALNYQRVVETSFRPDRELKRSRL